MMTEPDSLPRFAGDTWFAPPPQFDTWMAGGACELRLAPAARTMSQLHGVVSRLLADSGLGHDDRFPPFSIRIDAVGRVVLLLHSDEAAALVANGSFDVACGPSRATLRLGPLQRLRAPVVHGLGPRRVRVEALTPVAIRTTRIVGGVGKKVVYERGHGDQLRGAVGLQFCERLGLACSDLVRIEHVIADTRPTMADLGRKIRGVAGWTGRVDVRVNAVGEWLLRAAEIVGLGGRTAFGLGRISVVRT